MKGLISRFAQLTGWRAHAALFLLGLAGVLALPPIGWWPVFAVVFPAALIRFASVTSWRQGFGCGWLFGFGYFCGVLHWIGFAFLVEAETYLWMMPLAVGGLAAVMAIYWGVATAAAVLLLHLIRWPLWYAFPLCLAGVEWLRGHLMTGFPWAAPGLAADGMGPMLQVAALVGMPGLTLLIVLWCAALTPLVTSGPRVQKLVAAGLLLLIPLGLTYGWQRQSEVAGTVAGVGLRIVQPNISQEDKWRQDNSSRIFDDLVAASIAPSRGLKITHVIWPESAVPFLIDESEGAKNVLRGALAGEVHLITGAIRRAQRDVNAEHFTSVIVFDPDAQVIGIYDKWRLVPGGEFLPFAWLLEPLGFQRLVTLPGSFAAGPGPGTLDIPGAGRAGMIICYEAIFPDRLIDQTDRPTWIVNVTNDGWFGNSIGPYQHLAQARMRAVEQGLPLVRAANTGISAVIDPYGRVMQATPLHWQGVLDASLPAAVSAPPYTQFGDFALLVLIVAIGIFPLFSRADWLSEVNQPVAF